MDDVRRERDRAVVHRAGDPDTRVLVDGYLERRRAGVRERKLVNWKLGDGPRVNAPWASPRAGRTAYRARRARLGRTNAGRARGYGARAYNQLFWAQSWPCFQELELPRASSKPFSSCCARSELVPSAWAGIRPGACLCGLGVKRRPREGARTILSPSSTTPQGASDVCRGAEAGEENIFSQISRLLSD